MRIIAGSKKGLKLNSYDFINTRPTADMVREAVFNKLQFIIKGAVFLDLFGGTGAVALEAVSREAKYVVVCENNVNAISLIQKNFQKAGVLPNLIKDDYARALALLYKQNLKFDVVYLDPPFGTDFYKHAIDLLVKYELLNDGATVVIESGEKVIIEDFETECKKYGSIYITYLFFRSKA